MMYRWILPAFFFVLSSYSVANEKRSFFDQYHRVKRDPNWRLGINAAFLSPSSGLGIHLDTPSIASWGFGQTAPTGRNGTIHISGYVDEMRYTTPNLGDNIQTHQLKNATHQMVKFGIMSRQYLSENLSSFTKLGLSYLWMDNRVAETQFHQGMHIAIGSEIWGNAYTFRPLLALFGKEEVTCRNGFSVEVGSDGHNVRADKIAGSPTVFSGLYFSFGFVSEI